MKKIIRISLLLIVSLLVLVGCSKENNINEPLKIVNSKPLEKTLVASTYLFGDELTVPSVKLPYNGKEYDAKAYVKYPSGKVSENKTIKLNEAGEYTINYLAKFDDIMLSDSYSFVVTNELYSVVGEKSRVYYGTHEYMPDTKGIITSIYPNESFVYNKPIDLTTYNRNNEIITLNLLPQTIGIADAAKVIVTLTDIYDEDNFICFEMKKVEDNKLAWAENSTYVTAYSNGQDSCGLEAGSHPNTGRVVEYAGQTYTIHKNNYYGTWTGYAMTGAPRYESTTRPNYEVEYVGDQQFSFAIDYANGVIYGGPSLSLVNDLRSDIIYGSNFWTGFTTGEAYLSISAVNYNAESVSLIIKEIADESTIDMDDNVYADNKAPELDILWDNEYPVGLVNHEYPVFDAVAYDAYEHKTIDVSVNVYLNYGLSNQVNVPVKDGYFVPKYIATYYIEYLAKDKSGNEVKEVIPVSITDKLDVISIDSITEGDTVFDVGNLVNISKLTYKNAISSITEKITATLKSDSSISYEINNYEFRPLYAGIYEIKYEYSDYIFNDVYSYEITVNNSDVPLIEEDINLVEYYIKGCEYELPTYYGYIFENGKPVEKQLEIYITENGNTFKLDSNIYKPVSEGDVIISYVLTNNGKEARKDINVKAVDTGYDSSLVMGKYFYGDNFEISPESKYIEYSFINNVDTKMDFINGLPSSNFSIRLSASDVKDNFGKINIYLTDSKDSRIKLKFTYEKEPTGYVKFYTNDKSATNYKTLFASSDNPIILEYNNRMLQVSPNPNSYQYVYETIYGEVFNGFVSDKVYLSIEVEGIVGESALRIINICGQPFTKIKADIIEPKVYVYNDVGEYDINSIYTLTSATIVDVLDPNIKAFIRVKDPDGEIVTTVNGVVLDETAPYNVEHEIKLDKYGLYQVYYEAVDTNENTTTYTFVITVVDKEVPVVTIIKPTTSAKFGEKVNIAGIGITDNYSTEFEVYVSIIDPSGMMHSMTKVEVETIISKSFTASEKGVYKVCYYVKDSSGNTTFVSYEINVE